MAAALAMCCCVAARPVWPAAAVHPASHVLGRPQTSPTHPTPTLCVPMLFTPGSAQPAPDPQMSPELLPVLINALSEAGAFQQGGEPVPTSRERCSGGAGPGGSRCVPRAARRPCRAVPPPHAAGATFLLASLMPLDVFAFLVRGRPRQWGGDRRRGLCVAGEALVCRSMRPIALLHPVRPTPVSPARPPI